jgi:hypothetical protein
VAAPTPEEKMTNRSVRFAISSALGLALSGLAGVALAQDPPPPGEGTAPPPGAETTPPPAGVGSAAPAVPAGAGPVVTLRQGGFSVDGDVVIGLSSGSAGKPINIVPNFYYGISDQLSVGLAHNPGAEIFQTNGRGLCLTGDMDGGCNKVYNNLSLDALFSFSRSSTMDVAFHGGLDFVSLSDPTALSLRLGVKGKTMVGPMVIVFDPSINIGLTERDSFNKEFLSLPVRLGFMATPELNLGLSVGLFGALNPPIGGFGDFYTVPLGVGGTYSINSTFDVRAQFTLDRLIAGSDSGADARTLALGAAWRM